MKAANNQWKAWLAKIEENGINMASCWNKLCEICEKESENQWNEIMKIINKLAYNENNRNNGEENGAINNEMK
jgi:cytoplasmic iron level regulating protein YaaA (DUF328/UPF0246 family)